MHEMREIRLGLAVGGEDEAATGRQAARVDVVVGGRGRDMAQRAAGPALPVPMSYSQRFQRPVQAGTSPILAVFSVGHSRAKKIFLPS